MKAKWKELKEATSGGNVTGRRKRLRHLRVHQEIFAKIKKSWKVQGRVICNCKTNVLFNQHWWSPDQKWNSTSLLEGSPRWKVVCGSEFSLNGKPVSNQQQQYSPWSSQRPGRSCNASRLCHWWTKAGRRPAGNNYLEVGFNVEHLYPAVKSCDRVLKDLNDEDAGFRATPRDPDAEMFARLSLEGDREQIFEGAHL